MKAFLKPSLLCIAFIAFLGGNSALGTILCDHFHQNHDDLGPTACRFSVVAAYRYQLGATPASAGVMDAKAAVLAKWNAKYYRLATVLQGLIQYSELYDKHKTRFFKKAAHCRQDLEALHKLYAEYRNLVEALQSYELKHFGAQRSGLTQQDQNLTAAYEQWMRQRRLAETIE